MTEVKLTDRAAMTGARITSDGYLVAEVRCARTGCQAYMATELGLSRDGVVNVYRPESAVFAKDSLATFAGRPVTMGHPPEAVTADNWKTYAVGDVGMDIARDGEFVRVPIKLMDAAAIKQVQDGTREISMGYTTPLEIVDGTAPDGTPYGAVQTGPIKINHLAIVPVARGGSQLRIGDGAVKWGAAPITTSDERDIMSDALIAVVLGDAAVNLTADQARAVEKFKEGQVKALIDAKAEYDKAIATKDAEMAVKDAKIKDLEGKILSDAELDKRVADRAALIAKAVAKVPGLKTEGLSDHAIKAAVATKVLGDDAVKGKPDAFIDAAFELIDAGKAGADDPLKKPMGDGAITDRAKLYRDRNVALEGAWNTGKAA